MAKKYRIGVIGHTGKGNYGHSMDVVWMHLNNCEIVAVADADKEGLKKAATKLKVKKAYSDYRKMLDAEKLDIVCVASRWMDHNRDIVIAAANKGLHIYIEKPMCRSLEEADQMVAACEKNNVKLAIAHTTRYSPKLPVVRNMIEDGKIGELLELRGRGKEDRRGGGEDLWVLGSHIMNLIHYFGGEPNWCFAQVLENGQPVKKKDVKPGAEGIGPLAGDTVQAMYGLDNNVTAYFGSRRNTAGGRFALHLFGSKGIIEILPSGYLPAVYYLPDPRWSPPRSRAKWVSVSSAGLGKKEPLQKQGYNGNPMACTDLIEAIENDRQPECSIYEARNTVQMIAAIFESHRIAGPATMPLKNRKNPLTMLKE